MLSFRMAHDLYFYHKWNTKHPTFIKIQYLPILQLPSVSYRILPYLSIFGCLNQPSVHSSLLRHCSRSPTTTCNRLITVPSHPTTVLTILIDLLRCEHRIVHGVPVDLSRYGTLSIDNHPTVPRSFPFGLALLCASEWRSTGSIWQSILIFDLPCSYRTCRSRESSCWSLDPNRNEFPSWAIGLSLIQYCCK